MTDSPTILAIDAATGPCSVAIWRDGGVAAYSEDIRRPARQSSVLLPMIEAALAQCGMGYADLSAVACTVGPGSFTGIRVALAAARGIAFAAKLPQLGFTTLETMAFAARGKLPILSILDAGKGECYFQFFDADGRTAGEVRLGAPDEAVAQAGRGEITVAGNIAFAAPNLIPSAITFPRADALAAMAPAHASSAVPLKPFYIRPPDAKLPVRRIY